MRDFTKLIQNQVFDEDVNGFEARNSEKLGPGRDAPSIETGPIVRPNGDVLFRVYAPDAKYVKLNFGGTHIRTQKGVVIELEKKDDGCWEYLLPYSPTDVGPREFTINIDGATVINPYMPVYYRGGKINNCFEIPDPEFTLHHIKKVPHGTVAYRTYWSEVYDRFMRCVIYLPPEYNRTDRKYPVLFLDNGGSENETTWINAGKINYILDNLISEDKAVPMIVVMTNTMAFRTAEEAKDELLFGWKEMLLKDTLPFIESEYRVFTDKWNRAICGNSFGGVAAGFMAWDNPDLFGNIGFFAAPIRYENIWKSYEENEHMHWMFNNGDEVGKQYKVLFFSRGEAEYLTNWNLQMDDEFLSKNGILRQNCTHVRLYGGDFTHDFSTFRRGFADFCCLLFKDDERVLGQHKPDTREKPQYILTTKNICQT